MFETIVALATPPIKSALAVIRLSGDDCFDVVNKCFNKDISKLSKREIYIGKIIDEEKTIDEVVLLAYKNPHSFTGEDSVEIICHGSMLIANEIITTLIKCGARMATNGEFSSRSFLHNKMDLVQAESINDLINATSKEAKNVSLRALSGQVTNKILPLKQELGDLLSLIAVNIDYPEYHDIEVTNSKKIIDVSTHLINIINSLISEAKNALIIKDGLKVAIVGKPNVGKSSLLNAFLGESKAIVTDIAGTTRDIVEGDAIIGGITLHFLDTAGVRDTQDVVESIGVNKSKDTIKQADLVLAVFDSSKSLDEEDNKLIKLLDKDKTIFVYNKKDIGKSQNNGVYVSAKNGDISELKNEIIKKIGISNEAFETPALNNTRQIGLLEKAKEELLHAIKMAENDEPIDLISYSIMSSYHAVLEILGEENQLDLVKEIFSRFCVGK